MSLRIMVVDDEAEMATLFKRHFRREIRNGDILFHFALSGEKALENLDEDFDPELMLILSAGQPSSL